MHRWHDFALAAPEMAAAGQKLIYQFGIGLGYLATVRKDGAPRLHPFCPVIHEGGLYGLIVPSAKQRDLLLDGRYAFHAFPAEDVDDEFYLNGRIRRADEAGEAVRAAFLATGGTSTGDETCFEFLIQSAMLAVYGPRPSWPPKYTTWRASD
jgi:hypothetical protein